MSSSKDSLFNKFYFHGVRKYIIFIVVGLVLSSFIGAQVPKIMLELGKNYGSTELFYASLKSLGIVFIAAYLNRFFYQLSINKFVKILVFNLRNKCYSNWLHYDPAHEGGEASEDKYPQGEVIARIMSDTESIRELITSGSFGLLIDLFFVVSCLVSFIAINTTSGVALVVTEAAAAAGLIWGSKYMRKIFLEVRQARGELYKTVANVVGGTSEAYYSRHDDYASKKGEKVFSEFLNRQLISNIYDASYYSLAESLYPLLLALVVLIFPYSNIVEGAVILAIVDLIQRSIGPVKDISSKVANLQRALTGFIRIDQFNNDLSLGIRETQGEIGRSLSFDQFQLKIGEFYYPTSKDRFKISDVEIVGHPGEIIGIVGASGCGKSTVLKVMASQVLPQDFSITLKKQDESLVNISEDDQKNIVKYREQVGIVSQDSHIFSESLFFNITMKTNEDEEFRKFWDFVSETIPYLRTWGVTPSDIITPASLSLGQKQLVAALRSCFLKKSIVLFDEISSALDTNLEEALKKVLEIIGQSSLTFIVAHRLETVVKAHCIYVMDQGRVVNEGKHHDLLDASPIYRDFIKEISH